VCSIVIAIIGLGIFRPNYHHIAVFDCARLASDF
jgi:hypothetical protein